MAKQEKIKAKRELLDRVIHVAVSRTEQSEFSAVCSEMGISQSEGIRRLMRQTLALGPTLDGESAALIRELAHQTRFIGHNINQWTRSMHLGLVPLNSEVKGWIINVAKLLDRYEEMLIDLISSRARIAAVALRDEDNKA